MKHFALAGNPNSGKTTLFNSLTGSSAHVGNWPGVTVDKRTGTYKKLKEKIEIVDLPGIYSLSPYTPEEIVSRNYIIDEKPDCIVNVIDSTNIERNLYLTTQLLEIDIPVIIALNMTDILRKNGEEIKAHELALTLDVPIIEISALRGENLDELMSVAYEASLKERKGYIVFKESPLYHLVRDVKIAFSAQKVPNSLFHAVKLVEEDELEVKDHEDLLPMVNEFKNTFSDDTFGSDFEALVADARYGYISKILEAVVIHRKGEAAQSRSEKIDKVLTHKIWSIPIFLFIMFLFFHFTFGNDLFFMGQMGLKITNEVAINFFTGMKYKSGMIMNGIPSLGVFLHNWTSWFTGHIVDGFGGTISSCGYNGIFALNGVRDTWYASLICDGLLKGLDAVISFIPQILLLFLFIAILEDSGYMARVAFILDRAFRRFGLSGKAFIPMLTGFGCTVPAIMATRTLEDEKEKNRTIRLLTCFSCGAKAPIWTLLAAVGTMAGLAGDLFVFVIYIGGIALAIILAIFMKLIDRHQYVSPFIMELPQYHLPQARNVGAHLWDKFKHYITKAGTVIAASLIVIWFFQSFGWQNGQFGMVSLDQSMLSYFGRGLRYLLYPTGWVIDSQDGWKYAVGTLSGMIAKENVVGTLAEFGLNASTIKLTTYGVYAFAFFNLLSFPCVTALATAYNEQTNKEFFKTLLFWFLVSFGISSVTYWLGYLFELIWWVGLVVVILIISIIVISSIVIIKRNKKELVIN